MCSLVKAEVLGGEAAKGSEHLGEHSAGEAGVLLRGEVTDPVEAQSRDERGDVDEVACLCSPEESEHLVGGELFDAEHRAERPVLCGPDPGVDPEIDLG